MFQTMSPPRIASVRRQGAGQHDHDADRQQEDQRDHTLPQHRQRGYGAAVTAACTDDALCSGAQHVVLFTDLANPTSNALYQRLGYRPVSDRTITTFMR